MHEATPDQVAQRVRELGAGRVFGTASSARARVVHDPAEAWSYAFSREDLEDGEDWVQLRGHALAERWSLCAADLGRELVTSHDLIAPLSSREVDTIARQIASRLALGREYPEEIFTDLKLILATSKAPRPSAFSPMIDGMFAAYQRGAYPCGWAGRWPEGEIVWFVPPA
ncbi:hypothetical protein [Sandaracinus amylolyticus]|uniref:hypothetical protein n=1 Tax=Sandaracinus amylolyticus TaxID=927083 RepID=UPI0012ED06E8|nr:hypothetical protein [Sandaracinus amylolyticus]